MSCSPYQVVSVRHGGACLYGELIQTMEERQTVWLRPLCLWIETTMAEEEGTVVDLRNGPDIICPSPLVQPALDTDWLLLLEKLGDSKTACTYIQANQHLRDFLKTLTVPDAT